MKFKKLREIDDTDFENLVFDLMTAQGMLSVTWRTPGADVLLVCISSKFTPVAIKESALNNPQVLELARGFAD
ncbi:hypothetical protein ACFIQG_19775 [Comamonas odontotermitis]|uniref:hypothetical protein n=1 Tax=Comamonas odontotermitis TaxID=379895 RepID=UPI00366C3E43